MKTLLLVLSLAAASTAAVTLVSRSAGLAVPNKEAGNTELEFGDVNGDGFLDLVSVGDHGSPYVGTDQHGIMVWFGDGAGNWSVVQTGEFGYGGCAIGDINGDGFTDVAWGVHHNYAAPPFGDRLMGAALGDGTGAAWTPWDTGLATNGEDWGMFATDLADFDLDGDLDIICESFGAGNGVRVYENLGDGTWTQAWLIDGGNASAMLETGDFNADGCMDFLCTRWGTQVYFGDGAFGFTLNQAGIPENDMVGVDIGDFDADGRDDVLCSFVSDSGVRCYSYDSGSSEWVDHSVGLPTGSIYVDLVQFGHFDGDAHMDLVIYDDPAGTVYLGNGAGTWTADASWTMPSPGDATALRVDGDVDHDGREDIAVEAVMQSGWYEINQLRVYSPWSVPSALAARLLSPDGGETMYAGSVREIRWLTAVPVSQGQAAVDISLSTSGASGPWSPIASGIPDNGSFQWPVPPVNSTTCRLKLVARTASDTVEVISSGDFSILYQTGIEEEASAPAGIPCLLLAPNPAYASPALRLSGVDGAAFEISVYDVAGRRVLSRGIAAESPRELVLGSEDGGVLPPGLYVVTVSSGDVRVSARWVQL